jgi:hypothetical protein
MTALATSTRAPTLRLGKSVIVQVGAALVALAVVLFAPQVLNDGDTYWHLATGQWMLAHGHVPHEDVFSFPHAGQPWVTHEWLSELLMALAFRAGGWSGLLVLYAAVAAAAAALFAGALGRSLKGLTLIVTLVLAFACASSSLLIRPHLLVMPILVLWTVELLAAREAGRAPRPFMAALMLLWANLHGSYLLGFVLMAPLALEALVDARPGERAKVVREWGLVGLLSAGATLATPHGLAGILYPFQILSMGTLSAIQEWRPADFSKPAPFELALVATLFVCLSRGVRVQPLRLLLLLFLLHMTLQHERQLLMLGFIAPLLLARPLADALDQRPEEATHIRAAWLALAAVGVVLSGVRLAMPVVRHDGPTSPVTALEHVPTAIAHRPLLNSYGFGGYLIYKGVKPFIDGRSDMYGDRHFNRYLRIAAGDAASLDQALAQYHAEWTLFTPDEPVVRLMDARPGWRRLYGDRYAVVHVRTDTLGR